MNSIHQQLASCVLAATVLLTGCVERRMLIRSNPEGALVTVDHRTVGHTPVVVPFTYYGTRRIRLEKDGFETIDVKQKIAAPWYQIPPINFVADNFAMREIRDARLLEFEMSPKRQTNERDLLDNANQLRQDVCRDTLINGNGGF